MVLLAAGSTSLRADPEVQGIAVATAVVVLASILADRPQHEEPDFIALEAGCLDLIKSVNQATTFGVEYRADKLARWGLRPFFGAGITSDQSAWGYGGIRYATAWGAHIVITPSFAVGGYSQGHGKDLGHPAVIGRSGIDFEYSFDNDMRVGVGYHHMSNGGVLHQTNNPGTEVIGFTFSIPVH